MSKEMYCSNRARSKIIERVYLMKSCVERDYLAQMILSDMKEDYDNAIIYLNHYYKDPKLGSKVNEFITALRTKDEYENLLTYFND